MVEGVRPNGQLMEGDVWGTWRWDDDDDFDGGGDADDDDDGPFEQAINGGRKMFGEEGKTL